MTVSASLRSRAARTGPASLTALVLAGMALWGAPAAQAAPGDSGDIKIHKAGTSFNDSRDETKVCRFNLAASNFETVPLVNWTVTAQPKTPSMPTLTGGITMVGGRGHTSDYSLPKGLYQLTWTFPGGVPKQKVFRVDCAISDDKDSTPRGAVGAGGGGMPGAENGDSSDMMAPVLVLGAAGAAGLILVRRARHRTHGAA
ncbi:hypothetical protein [Streptomyces candidus]|uniref:Uncharacterized protein n=1 Tax=Streptomyces candidus TaxID=67283 RepID=A0A7X0LQ01_9ACTN|nr:hypothetical protein [Streptomyces candidus]MBB6436004.1 hypothetical protein [Streptomyces candidus]GHH43307.1 hypothetical protein GCM10018773_29080 [Streptomyces candidus]